MQCAKGVTEYQGKKKRCNKSLAMCYNYTVLEVLCIDISYSMCFYGL